MVVDHEEIVQVYPSGYKGELMKTYSALSEYFNRTWLIRAECEEDAELKMLAWLRKQHGVTKASLAELHMQDIFCEDDIVERDDF